jgi:16S rRNA (guanine1207-N2)-methyltransferase
VSRPSRDEAAARLAARELEAFPPEGALLVVDDPRDEVVTAARAAGVAVERWDRRASARSGRPAARTWPPPGPYRVVALHLPLSREELEMGVHAALSVLQPGGRLLVYGANDEGIRSAAGRIEPLVGAVGTLAVGGHARLLGAVRPGSVPGLRSRLDEWRTVAPLALPWGTVPWVSYPGVFAHGRLDEGTALLLGHLPSVADGDRVLDYGAGSGFVGAGVLHACAGARLTLLEVDAVAAAAARENVPGARVVAGNGWATLDPAERFEVVVANPPYHRGKSETLAEVEALFRGARERLVSGGVLRAVVQRRHPVHDLMNRELGRVRPVADQGVFRVWEGRRP